MPDPRGLPVDAVWDIETAHWDEFVTGAIWTPAGGVRVCRSEHEMGTALLSLEPNAVAWAHAGGKFDVLWLLDWCRRNDAIPKAQIHMSGSAIAALNIAGGPILRDSCRLIPMSLRDACTMFPGCAQKERLSLKCVCGKKCGGYCAIGNNMRASDRKSLEDYMIADVESLRDTLKALGEYCVVNGIDLHGTVASTAWKTAKEFCNLPDAEWELLTYKLTREAYKGGLCAVAQIEAETIYRFDRAGAYPAALKKPVPCGIMKQHDGKSAKAAWKKKKPGVYSAIVDMPEQMAPPLPVRYAERLVYPYGRLVGTWPRDELQHAEDCGAKILHVTAGVTWTEEKPLLRPHVEKCFALRSAAESKSLKTWLKFVANSLTGAFAQDPIQDQISLGDFSDDERYEMVGRYDWIWKRPIFRISSRAHVQWAATLTGDARIELHCQIVHAGNSWCYSDTDSNYATRMLTRNVGNELGQWVFEGKGTNFVALAPKVYTYEEDETGKRHARAKGIPDAVKRWKQIASGEVIKLDRGVKSLLVAARGPKIFEQVDTRRQVHARDGWIGARILDGTRTRAPSMHECKDIPT